MQPRASVGKWDMGFAVGMGMGKDSFWRSYLAGIAGMKKKVYLSNLVVGNGNGRLVSCSLASRVHSKSNNSTVSVSQRKRDTKATHTNPVIK